MKKNKELEDQIEEIEDIEELEEVDELGKSIDEPTPKIKKKMSKKAKIATICTSIVAGLIIIALLVVFVILPNINNSLDVSLVKIEDINFSNMSHDYTVAPTATVADTVRYDVTSVLQNDSYTDVQKAAAAMLYTTGNEIFVNQYTFYRYQLGTTSISGKSGSLIYQRVRQETTDVKYDTTLKLPVNHNFGATETTFVTNAAIRYVGNGYYHRFANDSDIAYDTETGLLSVDQWKKNSSSTWHKPEETQNTVDAYTDLRKTCVNFGTLTETLDMSKVKSSLIDAASVAISHDSAKGYYTISFSVNVTAANKNSQTTEALNNDNSGKNMQYNYCRVSLQVWDCGLPKYMDIDESWSGKIGAAILWYEGSAQSKSRIAWSYSDRDCTSFTKIQNLTEELCSNCN